MGRLLGLKDDNSKTDSNHLGFYQTGSVIFIALVQLEQGQGSVRQPALSN